MNAYVVGSNTKQGIVRNEVEHACCKCSGKMWTSPDGAKRIANGCWPLCLKCCLELNPSATKIFLPPAEEIRRNLGLDNKKDKDK